MPRKPKPRCSFCGCSQDDVEVLIEGNGPSYICDHCIPACIEVIEEERERARIAAWDSLTEAGY